MTELNYSSSVPVLIGEGDKSRSFERVSVNDAVFQEANLQTLIEDHPEVLPLAELDLLFSPAKSIGREVPTGNGKLDNLFISPSGGITLVETKLWKNPQSRREVVAQIIDYAQRIARWSYADLEKHVSSYMASKHKWSGTLYDWLVEKFGDLDDEATFQDRVSANLENGRFLLLIVGDGIQRNVQDMVSYLQGTPRLQYNLALVKLACYRYAGEARPLLFVPSILAKTVEVERAVVRIEMSEETKKQVTTSVQVPPTGEVVTPGEEAFYTQLRTAIGESLLEQTRQFVAALEEDSSVEAVVVRRLLVKLFFERNGAQQEIWLFELTSTGKVSVGGRGKWKSNVLPRNMIEEFWNDVGNACPKLRPEVAGESVTIRKVALADVLPHAEAIVGATRRFIARVQELENES